MKKINFISNKGTDGKVRREIENTCTDPVQINEDTSTQKSVKMGGGYIQHIFSIYSAYIETSRKPAGDQQETSRKPRPDSVSILCRWSDLAMSRLSGSAISRQLGSAMRALRISTRALRYAVAIACVLIMGVGNAWGTSQTYTIETPSQNVYTDATSGITVVGTQTTGKIDNTTSQKIFSAKNQQPLHITSIKANIKGIAFEYDDSSSGAGSENIMSILTSNGGALAALTSGYSGTISINGGSSSAIGASLSGLAIGKDQSTHCTISVTFTSAVSTIVVNTSSSNAAQIRNLVITYDDAISAPSLYATITPSGTDAYTISPASGAGSMTTSDVSSNTQTISATTYRQLDSGTNTYTPAESLVAGDIIVFTIGNTSSKTLGINVESGGALVVDKGIASQPYQIVYVVPSTKSTISFVRNSSDVYLKDIKVYHSAAAASCSAYEFHYGTNGEDNWETECFEQVGETNEWRIEDFTIPSTTHYYVGYHGDGTNGWNSTWSAEKRWVDWPTKSDNKWQGQIFLAPNDGALGSFAVGQATGATGTLTIHSDYNDYNKFLSFTPDGYGITYSGSGHAFAETATSNMWETSVVTLPNCTTTYNVGLATATTGTYVKSIHSKTTDEALSAMGVTIKDGGKKKVLFNPAIGDGDGYITDGSKIAVYDCTNASFDGFMTDSDEDGIYEGYVGSDCSTVCIVRYKSDKASPDWTAADIFNQTIDFGIGDLLTTYKIANWDDKTDGKQNNITSTAMHPTTGEKGKFRMWANSASDNWYVHWVPYYVWTYDANGGTGTMTPTERNSESSTLTATVKTNGFTRTGHHFVGWNPNETQADAGTKDDNYDPSDTPELTSNITLYAVWAVDTYDVATSLTGVTVSSGTTGDDAATYNTAYSVTFAGATGYNLPAAVTVMRGETNITANCTWTQATGVLSIPAAQVTGDLLITVSGVAKEYTITLDDNGGSADGEASVTYNGTSATITSAPTYDGHEVDYYMTDDGYDEVLNPDGSFADTNASDGNGYTYIDDSHWVADGADLSLTAHWKCNTPSISFASATNTVTISVPGGTTVYYTTDGTTPSSSNGTEYSTSFSIAADVTVKAIAIQSGCTDSEVASRDCDYTVKYYLINQSTGAINTTDYFTGVASTSTDADPKTIKDESSLSKYISFGSAVSPGNKATNSYVQYDVKTTSTTIYVYAYNTNASSKKIKLKEFKEGKGIGESEKTKSVTSTSSDTLVYNATNTTNATIYITVESTDVKIYQVVAVESGTALSQPGDDGYSISFNKGRPAIANGSLGRVDGIEMVPSVDYTAASTTYASITTKNTNYIMFTPTDDCYMTVLTANDNAYYISTSKGDVSGTAYTGSRNNIALTGSTTYYINPNGNEVQISQIVFRDHERCFEITDARKKGDLVLQADTVVPNSTIQGMIFGGQLKKTGGTPSGNKDEGIIFDANNDEYTVTLWGYTQLAEGSVISITQHGNASTGKATGFKISGNSMSPETYTNTTAYEENTQTYTIPAESSLIGSNSFTITWTGTNQVYLKSMYITGCSKETTYDITNAEPDNGSIAITNGSSAITEAAEGETVSIEATPANVCYEFSSWDVYETDDSSNKVTLDTDDDSDGSTRTFTMPAAAVTVDATFVQKNLAYEKTVATGWSRTGDSSGGKNDDEVASKAVDGSTSSQHIQWAIGDVSGNFETRGWWAVDLGDNYVLSDIKIYWQSGQDGRAPRSYEIQAAISTPTDFEDDHVMDDATSWRTIKTISGVTQYTGSTANVISFTLGEYAVARYLRLVNKDADRKPMALSEFEVFGVAEEECYAANTPTASFNSIADGEIKLNLAATNTNGDALTKFAVLYGGVYYDVTASEGVGTLQLPTHRDITVRVYAYDKCMQLGSGYVDVAVGDYVNPDDNLALNKTRYACIDYNVNEGMAKANDGNEETYMTTYTYGTTTNEWWYVDLGDFYDISKIEVVWMSGYHSTDYSIQYRQNAPADNSGATSSEWDEITNFKNKSGDQSISISDVQARYICLRSAARNEEGQLRLAEVRVYGTAYGTPDETAPSWTDANCAITSASENTITMTLEATDANPENIYDFVINIDNGTTSKDYEVSTEEDDNEISITDATFIEACQTYTVTAKCYDHVGNEATKVFSDVTPTPSTSTNLALDKTTYAGYSEFGDDSRANAVDGNSGTKWSSNGSKEDDNQWFTVDLGLRYDIGEIKVLFGGSGTGNNDDVTPVDFTFQTSVDNTNWEDVHHYTERPTKDEYVDKTISTTCIARYVRIWVKTQSTYGMHILELEVYSKAECTESYLVTLNTNGGTINADNVTYYVVGTGATLPTDVTKDGYRFMGWYDNSGLTGDAVTTIGTSATDDKEYWAKWAQLYTLTTGSHANGAIAITNSSSEIITEAIEGETVSIAATDGVHYDFSSWSIHKTGDESTTVSPAAATASTTFTMPAYGVTVNATFAKENLTLSYNDGGATSGSVPTDPAAGDYAYGTEITVPDNNTLAKSTDGFVGWLYNGETLYIEGQTFTMTEDVELTAVWNTACPENGGTLFSQDFDDATEVAYAANTAHAYTVVSADNNIVGNTASSQFTSITCTAKNTCGLAINSSTGGGTSVDASGIFQACFANTGGYWSICKTSNFATTAPTALKISMKVWAYVGSSSSAVMANFAIGDGFSNGLTNSSPAPSDVHSGFTITNNSNMRLDAYGTYNTDLYATNLTQSSWLTLTWVINNTGSSLTYDDPNSGKSTVNNDCFDVWLGTTRIVAGRAAVTGTKTLQNLYIGSPSGKNHELRLDDIVVTDLTPSGSCKFDVTFSDGSTAPASHSSWPSNIEGVPAGKKIANPADPTTTDDYVFGGWYADAACSTTPFDFSGTITKDTTLYAKWVAAPYTITWMVNGATYETTKASGSVAITLPTAPADNTLDGCANSFRGWSATNLYGEATSTQPSDLFIDAAGAPTITGNTTFYAVFGTATDAAYLGTVLWSEDWTGEIKTAVPTSPTLGGGYAIDGSTITYAWSPADGTSPGSTYVTTDNGGNLAGGSSPEVQLGKKGGEGTTGGSLTISNIPTGKATKVTLSYKQNANQLYVYLSGTGYSYSGGGTSVNSNTAGTKEHTIICGTDETFSLTFTATTTSNVRLDDIVIKVKEDGATDYRCICPTMTVTPKLVTASTPIFITSAASKTVRSQDSLLIEGSGLSKSTALTLSSPDSKFVLKSRTNTNLTTDANGAINAYGYIFYTPDAGDTSDGLDYNDNFTVSVAGNGAIDVEVEQKLVGRHLPADFVIAAKNTTTNKWYALPANIMNSESNPTPVEIAVDDINNPTIAYTANTNIYNLYGQNSGAGYLEEAGQYIKLGMKNNSNYPLYAYSSKAAIKGDATATVTNNIGKDYWWLLTQTNTSITNPQEAKYTISSPGGYSYPLKAWWNASGGPKWGQYSAGESELRLIPAASGVTFAEAEIVAWGKTSAIVEVDANAVSATQVIGKLPEDIASEKKALDNTSVKGVATKYNYKVNFGEGVDFSANEGKMLTLEWYNSSDVLVAISNIMVPRIIASSDAMYTISSNDPGWNTEVHVLPGVTLTADAGNFPSNDVTIKTLEIYPGATVVVTKGLQASGTLNVSNLILRNGWNRMGAEAQYDVARLYITPSTANLTTTNAYADWYIDYDQYYPIGVPWNVATSGIAYKNTSSAATAGMRIRYYDGSQRAGGRPNSECWIEYTWGGTMPMNLTPCTGYAMTARRPTGKAFSIVRMPLTIPSSAWTAGGEQGSVTVEAVTTHKDQVSVTGWGIGAEPAKPWYSVGWNFIANPYMATFNDPEEEGIYGKLLAENGGSIKYATIPDVDFKNYEQVNILEANLKPSSAFFIQANNASAQTITFASNKIVDPSAAPARFRMDNDALQEQEAYIRLSGANGKDQMGLIIGDDYTEAYEVNADLSKMIGDPGFVRTYMRYGNMEMAYVAINQLLAREWIPVTVDIPATGEYTYSLTNHSSVENLEGIYLIDYTTNTITNLIESDYTFTAAAGTFTDRFSINAIVGPRETPTDIDVVTEGKADPDKPVKFIWHDKVYILYNGAIYNATGKRVR